MRLLLLFVICVSFSARMQADSSMPFPYETTFRFPFSSVGGQRIYSLVDGRDGSLYGSSFSRLRGGYLFSIGQNGHLREVFLFPIPSSRSMARNANSTGSNPHPQLAVGGDGSIYGVTLHGGRFGHGTLFRFQKGGRFAVLHHFRYQEHRVHGNNLVLGSDGSLWGDGWGSRMFRYNRSSGLTVLPLPSDTRVSGLAEGRDKSIYLLTSSGGPSYITPQGQASSYSQFFRITDDHEFELLADFNSSNRHGSELHPMPDGGFLSKATPDDYSFSQLVHLSASGRISQVSEAAQPTLDFTKIIVRSDGSVCAQMETLPHFAFPSALSVDSGNGIFQELGTVRGSLIGWRSDGSAIMNDEVYNRPRSRVNEILMKIVVPGVGTINTPPIVLGDVIPLQHLEPSSSDPYVFYPLNNDEDFDGDDLQIVSFTQPSFGQVTWDPVKKAMSFHPGSQLIQDHFTYVVTDQRGGEETGEVTIRKSVAGLYREAFQDPTYGDCTIYLAASNRGAIYGWVQMGEYRWRIHGKTDDGGRLVVWSKNKGLLLSSEFSLDPLPDKWNLTVSLVVNGSEITRAIAQTAKGPDQ